MNRSIRLTSLFTLLMSVVLLVNLEYVQVFSGYADDPRNKRTYYRSLDTPRGQISAGGLVLATSDENGRHYPTDPLVFGPVEGYLSETYGLSGLELGYNDVLDGSAVFNASLTERLMGKKPAGANIDLTLQPALQNVAFHQLADKNYDGAVVAIRPSSGEILAMASTPSYDPALIVDPETSEQTWAGYVDNPGSPLLNHATQETLPPGSTFKVITTAAALSQGWNADSTVTAAPEITLPNTTTTLENYGGMRCGGGDQTTLMNAFTLSCNTAFAEMAMAVGPDPLRDVAKHFGLQDTYDIGLPMDAGTLGDLADKASLGQSAIGQRDVTMSVLENAVVAATVANGGKRMEPYLVSTVTAPDLKVLRTTKPKQVDGIDPGIAAQLTEMMLSSERHTVGDSSVQIASKTGTAEHGEDSRNSNPHAWYIAFAPGKDIAVAVVVKNGGDRGQAATGGSVAAPIGRAVIEAAQ
ncbi:penicillin-binding protein 2 [Corynebacterium argentoratense]|uniref:penicillin-binding protein 2 n=1 Tax=Corynebacterium argentoratense TaxID=42817 RepID=UPI0028D48A1C|nr:penicillin-binding protein 2 [Corynebacterium argentoratense]